MILNKPDALWQTYFSRVRECVHQLLAWGYEDIKSKVTPENQEEDITGWLTEAIDLRFNDRDTPQEYEHYHIGEETHVPHVSASGKNRKRIDIVISNSHTKPRPKFCFEAKRLKKGTHTIRKYTGDGGMQCFLKCEYAVEQPEAGMLAYIQDLSPDHWFRQLQKIFDNSKEDPTLNIVEPLKKVQVLKDLPHEWESKHTRSDGSHLDLLHVFLDFRATIVSADV
ncbi:MAG: hypothetical protein IV090_10030 [Candidatus Sericytochromatia bacterium]|nr:hypothetical protein [Candidatus Sericytochromatia bacterium]